MQLCELIPSDGRPRTVRVAGVQPDSLLQSPAFPAGGTVGLGPLVVAGGWSGRVPHCDGGLAVVKGHVLARIIDRVGGPIPEAIFSPEGPIADNGTAQQSAALPVKLRVSRCGLPADYTLIDSDSHLVVGAGTVLDVEVMVPTGWAVLPPTAQAVVPVEFALYVNVQLTVCPLRECATPGRVTWYDVAPADLDVLVRPARAAKMQVWGAPTVGSQWNAWSGDPALAGALLLGSQQLSGGFTNTDLRPGAASHFELAAGGGSGAMHWVWELD